MQGRSKTAYGLPVKPYAVLLSNRMRLIERTACGWSEPPHAVFLFPCPKSVFLISIYSIKHPVVFWVSSARFAGRVACATVFSRHAIRRRATDSKIQPASPERDGSMLNRRLRFASPSEVRKDGLFRPARKFRLRYTCG